MSGVKTKRKVKGKEAPRQDKGELKEDILLWDLYLQGMDSIHDTRVVNTDAVSYQSQKPKKCMETTDQDNKKNYPHGCLSERQGWYRGDT